MIHKWKIIIILFSYSIELIICLYIFIPRLFCCFMFVNDKKIWKLWSTYYTRKIRKKFNFKKYGSLKKSLTTDGVRQKKTALCICNMLGRSFGKYLYYKEKSIRSPKQHRPMLMTDANHNRNFPKIEKNKTKLNPVNVLWFFLLY